MIGILPITYPKVKIVNTFIIYALMTLILKSPRCTRWLTHGNGATNPSMLNTPSVAINFFPQSLAAINCFSRSTINCTTFIGFKTMTCTLHILISSKKNPHANVLILSQVYKYVIKIKLYTRKQLNKANRYMYIQENT